MIKVKRVLFNCIIFLTASCSKESSQVILPNGEDLSGQQIFQIKDEFSLIFNQYEGFKGIYSDSLLSEFVVLTDDIFNDVLSPEQIEQLETHYVTGIMFSKIPRAETNLDQLIDKLKSTYQADEVRRASDSNVLLVRNDNILCEIEYVALGVPGYIVWIGKH